VQAGDQISEVNHFVPAVPQMLSNSTRQKTPNGLYLFNTSFSISADVDCMCCDTGKRDATALAEASWNGPSPGWMEQLGALGSVNSDVGQHNNVRHGIYHCHFCNMTCTPVSIASCSRISAMECNSDSLAHLVHPFIHHYMLSLQTCRGTSLLCRAVLCCAVLCCAVLCCAVLCCAVLCCAVPCCAVLCCAVLCCAVL